MSHILVTNDFPPKVGGIQTYLWELWRRLPAGEVTVLTTPHRDAGHWDRQQPFPVYRVKEPILLPRRTTRERIRALAADTGAKLVVLDPALPLGLLGPDLDLPYAVVVHGAEVTVPGRLPLARARLARVLNGARGVVAAGAYPATEVARLTDGEVVEVAPGVDVDRFRPLDPDERRAARRRLDLPEDGPLIVTASRLVPRKGMDVLIQALPHLLPHRPDLTLAVAGAGRDAKRLHTIAGRLGVARRVRFLGRVPDERLPDVYGCGDVFAMLCRNRWAGLEQEGFGIVFLEAAACAVPSVAGASGGAADAVEDGVTGVVIDRPTDALAVASTLSRLLADDPLRMAMGDAARSRAAQQFAWDDLASHLHAALRRWEP